MSIVQADNPGISGCSDRRIPRGGGNDHASHHELPTRGRYAAPRYEYSAWVIRSLRVYLCGSEYIHISADAGAEPAFERIQAVVQAIADAHSSGTIGQRDHLDHERAYTYLPRGEHQREQRASSSSTISCEHFLAGSGIFVDLPVGAPMGGGIAMPRPWEADPSATFRRRLGKSALELGHTDDEPTCPDIWELDNGDIAVIGRDLTDGYANTLPDGVNVGYDERLVVIPGSMLRSAKGDIPHE